MRPVATLTWVGALLAPPRCAICAAACEASERACASCSRRLARSVPGEAHCRVSGRWSGRALIERTARELVAALKFHGRLGLAELAAAAVAEALGRPADGCRVVAVPAAGLRRRRRGFDPAELIAAAVAHRLGLVIEPVLARDAGPRQVGRRRAERLASPPRIRSLAAAPPRVVLIDDVITTGATLRACATALREAGCVELRAAVFARSVGSPCASAYHSG